MIHAPTLHASQSAMQAWLLHGDDGLAAHVAGEDVAHRLRIYADAYRLRLLEVLANDFPVTRAVVGNEAFDALALGYLRAHPSTAPSARHFGHAFADWLVTQRTLPEALPQLARFEWTQGECFDAVDAMRLEFRHIAALPPEAWPGLQLRLHPATRLLTVACNAADVFAADAATTPLPALRNEPPSTFVLWRSEGDVCWRRVDADEAIALHAIANGKTFAQLCERMHEHHGDDGAVRAASLLKRWLADGLLAAT
jgi:hypothetical protein